jgi:hypothetical protein
MMRRLVSGIALIAALGCDNAGQDMGLPSLPDGAIVVGLYFDRDGSETLTAADTVLEGARVALFVLGSDDTLQVATTDVAGLATFDSVPLGRYRFGVVRSALGDSAAVVAGDTLTIRLTAQRDSLGRAALVRVGYQQMTLAEARAATAGKRVIVRGLVTSAFQFFADSSTFLANGVNYLRVTSAEHRPGRNGNNPGDSVSVLGTTGSSNGQPVLLNGVIMTHAERPVPAPVEVSVSEVNNARGGVLDAALVRLAAAEITDTATVGADFHVWVTIEGVTALVVFDSKLDIQTEALVPGRFMTTRGVLVPKGDGTWYLKPRPIVSEIVLD